MTTEDVKRVSPVHQLNCAKLLPHTAGDPPDKCSCGAETVAQHKASVENRARTLDDVSGEEWNQASADYRKKIASVRFPQPEVPIYEVGDDSKPSVVPPVASEGPGATLTRWWVGKAQEEALALVPKAVEYGGAHRASDLTQLGRTIAELMGYTGTGDFTEGQLQELACYFYIQGKLGRWQAALLEGRQVSDDTVHDIKVYTTMVQRIREVGGWPV